MSSLAGCLLAPPLMSEAQPKGKVWRIGYLIPARPASGALVAQIFEALAERGYVEGRTMKLEVRSADDHFDRLPALATELVDAKVDIIVAVSPPAIVAAGQTTKSIPIVMAFWGGGGLIESGLVASFAHPGGNVTGVYMLADELEAKRLEVLVNALPKARRIGIISTRSGDTPVRQVREVAAAEKIELQMSRVPGPNGYGTVFEALAKDGIDGVLVPSFPRFYIEHRQIIEAAATYRIPAVYEWGEMARAGGLIAYGPILTELQRRAALYVDHILKGAKPGDLPVEQPTKFELVINLATAKTLGLTIPQSMLQRADEVIQQ